MCNLLKDKIANLPTTAFFWTTVPFMILFTCVFPPGSDAEADAGGSIWLIA
jgi:hypothetical protein